MDLAHGSSEFSISDFGILTSKREHHHDSLTSCCNVQDHRRPPPLNRQSGCGQSDIVEGRTVCRWTTLSSGRPTCLHACLWFTFWQSPHNLTRRFPNKQCGCDKSVLTKPFPQIFNAGLSLLQGIVLGSRGLQRSPPCCSLSATPQDIGLILDEHILDETLSSFRWRFQNAGSCFFQTHILNLCTYLHLSMYVTQIHL